MRDLEKLTIPRPASDIRLGRFDEVLARDLGRHISSRVKEGFRVSPSEAVGVLHHYVGSVRGLQLFDASSQADFEKLAARFAGDPSEKSFQAVEQYLNSLTPEAR
jgi:hypothetical protein